MAIPKKIDAEGQYVLTLTDKLLFKSTWLHPKNRNAVSGRALLEILEGPDADKVSDAQPAQNAS